jgi:alginate O-acetyltransferase complex protein AlgI
VIAGPATAGVGLSETKAFLEEGRGACAALPQPIAVADDHRHPRRPTVLFSSPLFLFVFLPVLLGLHALVGPRFRNLLLLVASLLFYMWGEGTYVLVMLGIIAINYGLGRWVESRRGRLRPRRLIAVAVVVNLGLLIVFKYSNFLVDQLNLVLSLTHLPPVKLAHVHLPLGISFFTFHALSYVIDVSRREVGSGKPLDFALYMTFFPHSIAGPIVRYGDIAGQLAGRIVTARGFAEGVRRFIIGLAKKMLVANTVAVAADAIFAIPDDGLTFGLAWLGVACYTLQIYFDFSGYSDMAIGLAKLFGIDFLENFNYPYAARSITDFWRRWHISLSTWFRDYLYIPLGGNRHGRLRTYVNLVMVFCLCGLWHGASWTFAGWGLFHGVFLVVERMKAGRMLESLWTPARHLYTLMVVAVGWVLFRADSMGQAEAFLAAMAGLGRGTGVEYHPWLYIDAQLVLALAAGAIGSAPVIPLLAQTRTKLLASSAGLFRTGLNVSLALVDVAAHSLLLLVSAMLLAAGTHNPFIYFRF